MAKTLNGNWKTMVTLVITTLLTACGWFVVQGYSSVIRRLDVIEEQTRELPAIRQQVEVNRETITQHSDNIHELYVTKADKK